MPEINRLLLHSYPTTIREVYKVALGEYEPPSRHKAFLRMSETGLEFLASMALSDYRTSRWNDPAPKVEDILGRVKRPSAGHFLELLRACLPETRPALLDFKQGEQPVMLPSCGRLSLAVDGVKDAVDLEAHNISRVIGRRLEDTGPHLDWLKAWDLLVAYRNKSDGHANAHQWPVDHPDYFSIMTPILEAAVTELLATTHLERVFNEHPIATLRDIRYQSGSYEHVLDADDEGVPVRTVITLDRSVTDLYAHPSWRAEVGNDFLLSRTPSGGFELRALFHDLARSGFPEPIQSIAAASAVTRTAVSASPPSTSSWLVGTATAAGTCGELVQGVNSRGEHFHVTCPIRKSATVSLRLRTAADWAFEGAGPELQKLRRAVIAVAERLDVGPLQVHVDHWTDLDVGKGMGSSTADIVAAARAAATAFGTKLSAPDLGEIACDIESSDGSMYPGLVAFQQRHNRLLATFPWWPQFAIVMVIPSSRFNTESADFTGKERLAPEFDSILERLAAAAENRNGAEFAAVATRSALLNQRFVPNPWFDLLHAEAEGLGASGVNIGHTGTVAGLLFPLPDQDARGALDEEQEALSTAGHALHRIRELLPPEVNVELTMTPAWTDR